ncbi:hypothetical protein ACLOJK_004366 [Asimina triloba]
MMELVEVHEVVVWYQRVVVKCEREWCNPRRQSDPQIPEWRAVLQWWAMGTDRTRPVEPIRLTGFLPKIQQYFPYK